MPDWTILEKEIVFTTSRSSGAGGQHVNKVETKVRACFSINESLALSEREKELIILKLGNVLDKENKICVSAQYYRSQAANKEAAINKLKKLIKSALIPKKKRKPTKVPASEKLKRLDQKKVRSKIKDLRKKPDF